MLGEMIKEIRKSNKMSQVELANKIGVTKQCVSNWENDNISPSIEMLKKIAKVFSVSVDYILEIDSTDYIDVSMLSNEEKVHIKNIVNDLIYLKEKNNYK